MASMTRRECLGFAAAGVVCGNATAQGAGAWGQ